MSHDPVMRAAVSPSSSSSSSAPAAATAAPPAKLPPASLLGALHAFQPHAADLVPAAFDSPPRSSDDHEHAVPQLNASTFSAAAAAAPFSSSAAALLAYQQAAAQAQQAAAAAVTTQAAAAKHASSTAPSASAPRTRPGTSTAEINNRHNDLLDDGGVPSAPASAAPLSAAHYRRTPLTTTTPPIVVNPLMRGSNGGKARFASAPAASAILAASRGAVDLDSLDLADPDVLAAAARAAAARIAPRPPATRAISPPLLHGSGSSSSSKLAAASAASPPASSFATVPVTATAPSPARPLAAPALPAGALASPASSAQAGAPTSTTTTTTSLPRPQPFAHRRKVLAPVRAAESARNVPGLSFVVAPAPASPSWVVKRNYRRPRAGPPVTRAKAHSLGAAAAAAAGFRAGSPARTSSPAAGAAKQRPSAGGKRLRDRSSLRKPQYLEQEAAEAALADELMADDSSQDATMTAAAATATALEPATITPSAAATLARMPDLASMTPNMLAALPPHLAAAATLAAAAGHSRSHESHPHPHPHQHHLPHFQYGYQPAGPVTFTPLPAYSDQEQLDAAVAAIVARAAHAPPQHLQQDLPRPRPINLTAAPLPLNTVAHQPRSNSRSGTPLQYPATYISQGPGRPRKQKQCACCATTSTPLWRDIGRQLPLCNACGIRWKKYGLICNNCNYVPCKTERDLKSCKRCGTRLPPPSKKARIPGAGEEGDD